MTMPARVGSGLSANRVRGDRRAAVRRRSAAHWRAPPKSGSTSRSPKSASREDDDCPSPTPQAGDGCRKAVPHDQQDQGADQAQQARDEDQERGSTPPTSPDPEFPAAPGYTIVTALPSQEYHVQTPCPRRRPCCLELVSGRCFGARCIKPSAEFSSAGLAAMGRRVSIARIPPSPSRSAGAPLAPGGLPAGPRTRPRSGAAVVALRQGSGKKTDAGERARTDCPALTHRIVLTTRRLAPAPAPRPLQEAANAGRVDPDADEVCVQRAAAMAAAVSPMPKLISQDYRGACRPEDRIQV